MFNPKQGSNKKQSQVTPERANIFPAQEYNDDDSGISSSIVEQQNEIFNNLNTFLAGIQEELHDSIKKFLTLTCNLPEEAVDLFPRLNFITMDQFKICSTQKAVDLVNSVPLSEITSPHIGTVLLMSWCLGRLFNHLQESDNYSLDHVADYIDLIDKQALRTTLGNAGEFKSELQLAIRDRLLKGHAYLYRAQTQSSMPSVQQPGNNHPLPTSHPQQQPSATPMKAEYRGKFYQPSGMDFNFSRMRSNPSEPSAPLNEEETSPIPQQTSPSISNPPPPTPNISSPLDESQRAALQFMAQLQSKKEKDEKRPYLPGTPGMVTLTFLKNSKIKLRVTMSRLVLVTFSLIASNKPT